MIARADRAQRPTRTRLAEREGRAVRLDRATLAVERVRTLVCQGARAREAVPPPEHLHRIERCSRINLADPLRFPDAPVPVPVKLFDALIGGGLGSGGGNAYGGSGGASGGAAVAGSSAVDDYILGYNPTQTPGLEPRTWSHSHEPSLLVYAGPFSLLHLRHEFMPALFV